MPSLLSRLSAVGVRGACSKNFTNQVRQEKEAAIWRPLSKASNKAAARRAAVRSHKRCASAMRAAGSLTADSGVHAERSRSTPFYSPKCPDEFSVNSDPWRM